MLVLDGNAFYEIDEECLKEKKEREENKEKNTASSLQQDIKGKPQ